MRLGRLELWPPLLLAPMAGLTHSALRTAILGFGGVGLLSTEMLAAARLPAERPASSPYLVRTAQESPLSYQLLLADDKIIGRVFEALHRLRADAVDLNLGCPAPQVRRAGGGSSLMDDPDRVRRIVAAARKQTSLPLSAKIRLGETLSENGLRDFCRMLADEGIDMLTVHARLRGEPFTRPPRWEWVAKVKQWVDVPVIANGSIDSVDSARACLKITAADGLMIGRAAARQPWVFASIAREVYGVAVPEPDVRLPRLYADFVASLNERFLPERRLGRLKEFTHHFATNYFFGHHLAAKVQASESIEQAWEHAEAFFALNDSERTQQG
ncbi:MAG: tRNA-dihydrouridine synthase family protein [Desulfobulbus sp.]|jgi:nifR3 family TIM-barrel protein|uniref:tRNA dihydrouridine synthase n=1 Tax=Desulfobulbus sp. TaxID=895 RepID=UPI00283AB981|nr:tRNA-dihydrouridine synthase family protein [Desulfobulbus sp.]MDR2551526.1 tRNA-dihydrouridine synthase family protein [Desulfobulbus sp.]